jgi:hypothetical protein
MNCIEFRQLILADPTTSSEQTNQHKLGCNTCAAFEREIHGLDESLRTALTVAIPEGLAAKVLLNQSLQSHPRKPTRWYWMSMAASFFVAVFVFQMTPADSLDDDIVEHLDHEAHQIHGRSGDISSAEVRTVLYAINGDLNDDLNDNLSDDLRADLAESFGKVTYASKCYMNEQLVAHFVVENGGEPYTLIVIPTKIRRELSFQNDRWHGVITPHPTGSLAIITSARAESTPALSAIAKHYGEFIRRRTI